MNEAKRETLKAVVRTKLAEGKTYREISKEVGVSTHTIHYWQKQTTKTEELETIKKTLTELDLDLISKTSHFNHMVLDELIAKAHNGELTKQEIKTLSRVGVDIAKIHATHWNAVNLRDGLMEIGQQTTSPATMLALLLAKAASDREAAARLDSERAMFEAANKPKDVIDVK